MFDSGVVVVVQWGGIVGVVGIVVGWWVFCGVGGSGWLVRSGVGGFVIFAEQATHFFCFKVVINCL